MSRLRRLGLILSIVVVCVALDQVTKYIAIQTLKETRNVHVYLGDLFRLQYAENTGAFLSLGSTLSDGPRFWLLTGLNMVILTVVGFVVLFKRHISTSTVIALTLILSGGIGNLIDRIGRDGRVVDFMNMGIGGLRTGIFNIADLAIVGGLVVLIAMEILHARRGDTTQEANAEE
jgi:signal peptidase II